MFIYFLLVILPQYNYDNCVHCRYTLCFYNYNNNVKYLPSEFLKINYKPLSLKDNILNASEYKDTNSLENVHVNIKTFLIKLVNSEEQKYRLKYLNFDNLYEKDTTLYYYDRIKSYSEMYYLGSINYSSNFISSFFLTVGNYNEDSKEMKIIMINNKDSILYSLVEVSSYLYSSPKSWPINSLTTTKFRENGTFVKLNPNMAPDVIYTKLALLLTTPRQRREYLYGSCAKFRIHKETGAIKPARFWLRLKERN